MSRTLPLLCLFLACGPSTASDAPVRAHATLGDVSLALRSDVPLHAGQNRVQYEVLAAGQPVHHALIHQHATAMSGDHACPAEDPDHEPDAEGLFQGLLVFTDAAKWNVGVDLRLDHDDPVTTLSLGALDVAAGQGLFTVQRDGQAVTLSLGLAGLAHVGSNEVVVTAHTENDLQRWEPVNDLSFELVPEMPMMGHGSSGTVAPTLSGEGVYRGHATLSMAGDWVLHLTVRHGAQVLGTFELPVGL